MARTAGKYREVEVSLVALDDVLCPEDLEDVVIKLDVEGAERLALAGMRDTLRDARKLRIFVEVNPWALEAGGASAEDLRADLRATQFHCAEVDERRSALIPLVKAGPRKKGKCAFRETRGSRR
jgi:Methyltransferase FkbM domain